MKGSKENGGLQIKIKKLEEGNKILIGLVEKMKLENLEKEDQLTNLRKEVKKLEEMINSMEKKRILKEKDDQEIKQESINNNKNLKAYLDADNIEENNFQTSHFFNQKEDNFGMGTKQGKNLKESIIQNPRNEENQDFSVQVHNIPPPSKNISNNPNPPP